MRTLNAGPLTCSSRCALTCGSSARRVSTSSRTCTHKQYTHSVTRAARAAASAHSACPRMLCACSTAQQARPRPLLLMPLLPTSRASWLFSTSSLWRTGSSSYSDASVSTLSTWAAGTRQRQQAADAGRGRDARADSRQQLRLPTQRHARGRRARGPDTLTALPAASPTRPHLRVVELLPRKARRDERRRGVAQVVERGHAAQRRRQHGAAAVGARVLVVVQLVQLAGSAAGGVMRMPARAAWCIVSCRAAGRGRRGSCSARRQRAFGQPTTATAADTRRAPLTVTQPLSASASSASDTSDDMWAASPAGEPSSTP